MQVAGAGTEACMDYPRVLLVDGSPTQSARLSFVLEQSGYAVSWAKNGAEAQEMALTLSPDAILSEVNLAGLDGIAFCQQVKQHPELFKIPVLLATSLSEPNNILRGLAAQADGFLIRPHTDDDILRQLEFAIKNRNLSGSDSPILKSVFYMGDEQAVSSGHHQVVKMLLSNYDCAARQGDSLRKQILSLSMRNKQLEVENEQLKARDLTVSQELSERSPQTQVRVQQLMKFLEAVTKERDDFLKDLHLTREANGALVVQLERDKMQAAELQAQVITSDQAMVQMRQEYLAAMARLEILEIEQLELFEYIHALTGERPPQPQPSVDEELAELRRQHQQSLLEANRAASRLAGAEWKLQLRDDRIQELEAELVKLCGQLGNGET